MTKGVNAFQTLNSIVKDIIVSHSKGTLMWQVIATDGTRERQVVTSRWKRANHLARKALDLGWKVKIKEYYADLLIADPDGNFLIIAKKVRPQEAAKFSVLWIKKDDSAGCIIWPHGRPMPHGWNVIS